LPAPQWHSLLHILGVTTGGLSVGGISSANCPGAISGHKFMEKQKDSVKVFYVKGVFLRKFSPKNHKTPLKNPKMPVRKTRKRLRQDLSNSYRAITSSKQTSSLKSSETSSIISIQKYFNRK
jgi:hypothetical protein